ATASRRPSTMESGCRWTPSKTVNSSRISTPAATRHGKCGTTVTAPLLRATLGRTRNGAIVLTPDHPMHPLHLRVAKNTRLNIVCLGSHSDDIEIGCGGLLLRLIGAGSVRVIDWVVFSAQGPREQEARRSADLFLTGAPKARVTVKQFRDGFFPFQ